MLIETLHSRRVLAAYQVTTSDDVKSHSCDAMHCTLRDAVLTANANPGADTITFAPSLVGKSINLRSPLQLTESLAIHGPGADKLLLSGLGIHQLFKVGGPGSNLFEITDLTLANARGSNSPGGAIAFDGLTDDDGITDDAPDTLKLHALVIRNNLAFSGAGVYAEGGSLIVTNTSFYRNTVTSGSSTTNAYAGQGAAILQVGGIGASINNSFVANVAPYQSGVVTVAGKQSTATMEIVNSTFADNSSRSLLAIASGASADVSVQTSLFSGGTAGTLATASSSLASATITSLGNNLSDDYASGFLDDSSDRLQTDALLRPLDTSTFTRSLQPGSPAIDSLAAPGGSVPTVDQLGNSRLAGTGVDVGAVEAAYDFGDAPPQASTGFEFNYPTLAIDSGAYHVVAGPRLGATVDSERDGQPSGVSRGDQFDIDDEDGVVFFGGRYQSINGSVTMAVDLQNASSSQNMLDAWIDWNRNGSWLDEGEQFATSVNLGVVDRVTILEVPLPDDYQPGPAHFRFRLSTTGGLTPQGGAADGEVEDYTIMFMPSDFVPHVDNPLDENDGDLTPGDVSLREAIEYVNEIGGNTAITIDAALAGQTLSLVDGPLQPTRSMKIIGPTASPLVIDAQGKSQIISVDAASVDLAFSDIEFTGGWSDANQPGGAIGFASGGNLDLTRVVFHDNHAGGDGGAIALDGAKLTLIDSRLSDNDADGNGGAIAALGGSRMAIVRSQLSANQADLDGGGIVARDSSLLLLQSSVVDNAAGQDGGGIWIHNALGTNKATLVDGSTLSGNHAAGNAGALYNHAGLVTIASSTIARNQADADGGGVLALGANVSQTRFESSIVAENTTPAALSQNVASNITELGTTITSGIFQSNGFNVLGIDAQPHGFAAPTDQTGIPVVGLAPLGTYGGTLMVHPLADQSVALDRGRAIASIDTYDLDNDSITSQTVSVDARGVRRTIDLASVNNTADGTDVGAIEMIGLSVADAQANESRGVIEFTATLTDTVPELGNVEFALRTTYLSAVPGIDFVAPDLNSPVTFASDTLEQTLFVELIDDALIENEETFAVTPLVSGGWALGDGLAIGTILSDDAAGIVLSKSQLTASESGRSDTLAVSLSAQPLQDVTIDLQLDRNDEAQLDRLQLVFTADNWNVPQNVVVSATNDQYIDGPQTSQVTVSVGAGSDPDFISLDDLIVPVTTIDNDVAGISVVPLGRLTTTESGSQASFAIKLDALPTADVTITLHTSDPSEAVIDRPTLTFTHEDGTSPQTIVVTGVDDDEVDGNVMLSIVIDPASSDDPAFDGLNAADVPVRNLDDERLDFGDAPSSYPSALADDGARHGASDLYLGTKIDFESDAIVSSQAEGDGGDEDGVHQLTTLLVSDAGDSQAAMLVNASGTGRLDAWFDFNRDGDWFDAGEHVSVSRPVKGGDNIVPIVIPAGASAGETFARFRFSSDGGLGVLGQAADGEVEDYRFMLVDGNVATHISVQAPSGDTRIQMMGDQLVVTSGAIELFHAPLVAGTTVELIGSSGDDRFELGDVQSQGILVDINAGFGRDTVAPIETQSEPNWLNATSGNMFNSVEAIDLQSAPHARVQIDAATVAALTGLDNPLDVITSTSEQLILNDQWQTSGSVNDGQVYQVLQNGDAQIRVVSTTPWTNFLHPLDVNASGLVTALDALIILNSLTSGLYTDPDSGQLLDPSTFDPFPNLYLDTNGDGRLSPVDSLIVLNSLSGLSTAGEWASPASEGPSAVAGFESWSVQQFAREDLASKRDREAASLAALQTTDSSFV